MWKDMRVDISYNHTSTCIPIHYHTTTHGLGQFKKTFERLNMFTNLPDVTNKECEYKIIFSISQNPLSFPFDSSLKFCKPLLQGSRVFIINSSEHLFQHLVDYNFDLFIGSLLFKPYT
ncbi:hypothetical protein Hanom_Chr04g00354381 [Helianthus anomalus]